MSNVDEQEVPTAHGMTTRGALRQRVSILSPGIVLVREAPGATAETWSFMAGVTQTVGAEFEKYVMVLDLSEATGRPKGKYLETIRHTLQEVLEPIHLVVVQPGSAVMRSVLRFVVGAVAKRTSVHKTLEDAITAARSQLEGGSQPTAADSK